MEEMRKNRTQLAPLQKANLRSSVLERAATEVTTTKTTTDMRKSKTKRGIKRQILQTIQCTSNLKLNKEGIRMIIISKS